MVTDPSKTEAETPAVEPTELDDQALNAVAGGRKKSKFGPEGEEEPIQR